MVAQQSSESSDFARARANRRNARRSTGPRSAEGKARAARNSVTHGLFCRDLVLPGEDGVAFVRLRRSFVERLRPQDELELAFVERVAECQWKLQRLTRMESDAIDPPADGEPDPLADVQVDREIGRSYLREMMREGDGYAAAGMLRALSRDAVSDALDRYSHHRQRLEHSISRSLRELRQLRKDAGIENVLDLPPSPYLDLREPPLITPPPPPPPPAAADSVQPYATDSSISQNEPNAASTALSSASEPTCAADSKTGRGSTRRITDLREFLHAPPELMDDDS